MKKSIIALAAITSIFATSFAQEHKNEKELPKSTEAKERSFSAVFDIAYSSRYLFRGVERADDNAQLGLKLQYGSETCKGYVGVWQMLPNKTSHRKETQYNLWQNNAYIGAYATLNDYITVDGGFINYLFPKDSIINDSQDIYLGAILSVPQIKGLRVKTYAYYNIELDSPTIEPSILYSFDLTPHVGVPLWIDTAAYYGVTCGGRDFVNDNHHEFYTYMGTSIDLTTRLGEGIFLSVGADYGTNYQRADTNDTNNNVWWNARIAFAY